MEPRALVLSLLLLAMPQTLPGLPRSFQRWRDEAVASDEVSTWQRWDWGHIL